MRFLILIYANPASREVWESLSTEERRVGLEHYRSLNAELEASGELIESHSLREPELTTTVLVRGGTVATTDGPFAEVKEHLAGFYLVECASRERAITIAARIPEAEASVLEVRPVRTDLDEFLT